MDQADLANLQDLVIDRVLTSAPLPGQTAPISFPDLAYVTQADEALLIDDGYLGQTTQAVVVNKTELRRRCKAGEQGFLKFQPPLEEEDKVTLQLRVLLGFADLDPLPLGELVVTFTRLDGEWTTIEPTHAVAF